METAERSNYFLKENLIFLSRASDVGSNIINDVKLSLSVQQSINNLIKKEGYLCYKIFIQMISTKGGNYLGQLYEVDIKGETSQGPKETNIFIKHIIPSEGIQNFVSINESYMNEVFFYTELGTMFYKVQEAAQISEDEKFKLTKHYNDICNEAILLDNLSKKGFKTFNRMDVIPVSFAEVAIQQLAKFHALSFILKHQRNEYFENNIGNIKTSLRFDEPWKEFIKGSVKYSLQYFDSGIQNKIDKFVQNILYKNQPKYLTGDTKSIRCLCHGDFRSNNLLFKKYAGGNFEVTVIDYQLIFYGSPVLDLIYLMFTSADREFRKDNMKDLKNLYHKTLTGFLQHFDLDVNDVYPKNIFEKDFNDYLDYGLMVGLYVLPYCFVAEDDTPDFSKDTVEDLTLKLDNRFRVRITEVVQEYLELGIL